MVQITALRMFAKCQKEANFRLEFDEPGADCCPSSVQKRVREVSVCGRCAACLMTCCPARAATSS